MLRFFWDDAVALDPAIEPKDERHMKLSHQGELRALWRQVGLTNISEEPITIDQAYSSFNDYWEPFRRVRDLAAPTLSRCRRIDANSSKRASASACLAIVMMAR